MSQAMPFGEQQELIATLHRRIAEAGRKQIATDVQEARAEFASGMCKAATAEEIMRSLLQ